MKILSICSLISGFHSASCRVLQTMKAVSKFNASIDFVQIGRESAAQRLQSRDLQYEGVNCSVYTGSPFSFPWKVKDLISNTRYDMIIGNGHFGTFYASLVVPERIPIIFDMHGVLPEEFCYENSLRRYWCTSKNLEYMFYKIIDFVDLHRVSLIACVSYAMMRYMNINKKIPLDRLVYVPNAVDLETFRSRDPEATVRLRKHLNLDNKFVFGYVGDMQPYQGLANLITAARSINDPRVIFLIVGGEHLKSEKNIVHVSRVPRREILNYYSLCDVLVLPRPFHLATEVAAPTKFVEYTAVGKPILTTDVGDAAQLVRQWKCGLVVKNNSPEELMKGITTMVETPSRELYTFGSQARMCASHEFSMEKVVAGLSEAISGLLNSHA